MKGHLIKKIILMVGIIAVLGVASSAVVISSPASAQKGPEFIPGRYIVVLQDGVSPQDVARGHGFVPEFVYSHAINGFAGPISPVALEELKQDSRVLHIEQDQKVYAFAQTNPTGIERMDAEPIDLSNLGDAVTIAILDTGIDLDHPDLNVVHSIKCAKGGPFGGNCGGSGDDDNGHGTHVAGTAAGVNNEIGVVGVAPGADLWAVKVLDQRGSGYISWIVGGIDYVTANADVVDVANMSLGCECSSLSLDMAITASVAAGVTYVVAAGNSDKDASTFSPANHSDVITVSAIADSDGMCGGLGISTSYGADDTLASFSNFGPDVEIAAPGVNIYSTLPGGYGTYSGTSMASPHVAGAAALLIASNPSLTPAEVRGALIANGVSQTQSCDDLNGGFGGFSGDSDGSAEPLVYVGDTSVGDSPVVSITTPADGSTFHVGDSIEFTGSASDTEDELLTASSLIWTSNLDGQIGTGGIFTTTTPLSEGTHTVTASVTDSDENTGSASITVNMVNDAPVVMITSPPDDSTFDSDATILFEGSASDTEDGELTASSLVWTSNLVGQIGTGESFQTTLSDGEHTITAAVTDSGEKTGSASISITVGDAPTTATTVSVGPITYATEGGKNKDKHLLITIELVDDLEGPVSGASVSIDLFRDGNPIASGTGTTGTDGTLTFSLKNASAGKYTTTVTDVITASLTWDGVTPLNSFEKISSSTRNQNSILTS